MIVWKKNSITHGRVGNVWGCMIFLVILMLVSCTLPCTGETVGEGYEIENRADILPYPFSRGSAVWSAEQECIYIFGGRNETDLLDTIMKYTPKNNQLTVLSSRLPTVLMGSTAVYDGKHVYIFGGKDYDKFYDSILRFDPGTEKISNMTARLPNPTVGAAALWTGEYIYFFGGCWGGILPQKFDSILRYDPSIDNLTVMNSTLPYGRSGLAATWDGTNIYVIGGSDDKEYSAEILKYSPENDTLSALLGKLPSGRKHIQAEFHNGSIYIFGGRGGPTTVYNDIIKYDLETDNAKILPLELPNPSELRMHAYDGENIYIIGGFDEPENFNQFIRFRSVHDTVVVTSTSCPEENPFFTIGMVFIILLAVIIVIAIKNYKKDP